MTYTADITIMPLKELLDPQGQATQHGLHHMGFHDITDVRIGKHIRLVIEADDPQHAWRVADEACRKLLANPIMESYSIHVAA